MCILWWARQKEELVTLSSHQTWQLVHSLEVTLMAFPVPDFYSQLLFADGGEPPCGRVAPKGYLHQGKTNCPEPRVLWQIRVFHKLFNLWPPTSTNYPQIDGHHHFRGGQQPFSSMIWGPLMDTPSVSSLRTFQGDLVFGPPEGGAPETHHKR